MTASSGRLRRVAGLGIFSVVIVGLLLSLGFWQLQRRTENQSPNLHSIVDRVRPSVEGLLETELRHDPEALVRQAVRANIRASTNQLRHGSEILENLIREEGLMVVGAEYSLDTGVVHFFDGAV